MKKLSSEINLSNISNFNSRLMSFLTPLKMVLGNGDHLGRISSSLSKLIQYKEFKGLTGEKRLARDRDINFHIALIASIIRTIKDKVAISNTKKKEKLCDFFEEILLMANDEKSMVRLYQRLPYDRVLICFSAKDFTNKQLYAYLDQILGFDISDYGDVEEDIYLGFHLTSFVIQTLKVNPTYRIKLKNFYDAYVRKLIQMNDKLCENPRENSVDRYSMLVANLIPLIRLYLKCEAHQELKNFVKLIYDLWCKHSLEKQANPTVKSALTTNMGDILQGHQIYFQSDPESFRFLTKISQDCQSAQKPEALAPHLPVVDNEEKINQLPAVREICACIGEEGLDKAWQKCMAWQHATGSKDSQGWMWACLKVANIFQENDDDSDESLPLRQLIEKCKLIYEKDPTAFDVLVIKEIEQILQYINSSAMPETPSDSKQSPLVPRLDKALKLKIETVANEAQTLLSALIPDFKNSSSSSMKEKFSQGLERFEEDVDSYASAINDYLIDSLQQFHQVLEKTPKVLEIENQILEVCAHICKLISADNKKLIFYNSLLNSYRSHLHFLQLLNSKDAEDSELLQQQEVIFSQSWQTLDEFDALINICNDISFACRLKLQEKPKNFSTLLTILTRFAQKIVQEFTQLRLREIHPSKMPNLCLFTISTLVIIIGAFLEQYQIGEKQVKPLLANANSLVLRIIKICDFLKRFPLSNSQQIRILDMINKLYICQKQFLSAEESESFRQLIFKANDFIKEEPGEIVSALSEITRSIREFQAEADLMKVKANIFAEIADFLQLAKQLMSPHPKKDPFSESKMAPSTSLDLSQPLAAAKILLRNIFKSVKPAEADFKKFIQATNAIRALIPIDADAQEIDQADDAILALQAKIAEKFPKSVMVICLLIDNAWENYKKKKSSDLLFRINELLKRAVRKTTSVTVFASDQIQFAQQLLALIDKIYPYFLEIQTGDQVILEFNASLLDEIFSLVNQLPVNDNFSSYYYKILKWISSLGRHYLQVFAAERAVSDLDKLDNLLMRAQQLVKKLSVHNVFVFNEKKILLEFNALMAEVYGDFLIPYNPSLAARAEKFLNIQNDILLGFPDRSLFPAFSSCFEKIHLNLVKIEQAYQKPVPSSTACETLPVVPVLPEKPEKPEKPKKSRRPIREMKSVAPATEEAMPPLQETPPVVPAEELYRQQIAQLQSQIVALEMKIQEANTAMEKNRARGSKKILQLNAAKLEIQNLTQERDKCLAKLAECQALIQTLQDQLHRQGLEIADYKDNISARDHRMQILEHQQTGLMDTQATFLQTVEAKDREINSLRRQLQEQEQKHLALMEQTVATAMSERQKLIDIAVQAALAAKHQEHHALMEKTVAAAMSERQKLIDIAVEAALAAKQQEHQQQLQRQRHEARADVVATERRCEALFLSELRRVNPTAARKWKPNFSFSDTSSASMAAAPSAPRPE